MRKRNVIRLSVVSVVVGVLAVSGVLLVSAALSSTPVEAGMIVPDEVLEGMRSVGSLLELAPEGAPELAQVNVAEALAVAQTNSEAGKREPASVSLAVYSDTVTRATDESGDAYGPLLGTQKRLVYVFVFEGLNLYPSGEPGAVFDAATVHHELVVLIDAVTGDWISSTTFR